MEIISGIVTNIERDDSELLFENQKESVIYYSVFSLDGASVRVTTSTFQIIDENDLVAVAGTLKGGVFEGLANTNLNTEYFGHEEYSNKIGYGIVYPIFFVISFWPLSFFLVSYLEQFLIGYILIAVSIVIVGNGAYDAAKGFKILKAKRLLQKWLDEREVCT